MKFSIAAVALLVGNGLALTQEEQAIAEQQAIGVQETAENINDVQAADEQEYRRPQPYAGGSGPDGYGSTPGVHPGRGGGGNGGGVNPGRGGGGNGGGVHPGRGGGGNGGGVHPGHDGGVHPGHGGGVHPGHGGGYGGSSGCKDDVHRVKSTLQALLKQVDQIRCESCPKPSTHPHRPTSTYHRPATVYPKPTSAEHSQYPTQTYTKPACATPTCGKSGVKFNRYSNPFHRDFSSSYKTFDLQYFLKQKPLESGVSDDIYLKSDPRNKTYAAAAMEYRTFLFACESGKYKFTSDKSDDITLMWFGDNVKDATRDNADIFQAWYGENKPQTVYKSIKAGVYYPIRVLWGNTNGAGYLNLDIYSPNGQKLTGIGGNKKGSYIVTEDCQGSNPYGNEAKTAGGYEKATPTGLPARQSGGGSYGTQQPDKVTPRPGGSYDGQQPSKQYPSSGYPSEQGSRKAGGGY